MSTSCVLTGRSNVVVKLFRRRLNLFLDEAGVRCSAIVKRCAPQRRFNFSKRMWSEFLFAEAGKCSKVSRVQERKRQQVVAMPSQLLSSVFVVVEREQVE